MTNPKALIATANTLEDVTDLYFNMVAEVEAKGTVTYIDVNGLQVTIVYQPTETKKTKKVINIKGLNVKAQDLCLYDLMVERRDNNKIAIVNQKDEVLYTCKTPLGISRKLTAIRWERQIKMLKLHDMI